MVLVDTSIWLDHLRRGDARLAELLDHGQVLMHPCVLGEVACGGLRDRASVLALLASLPATPQADDMEARHFIEHHALHGQGIDYVHVLLLAAVALLAAATLWTRDKRLQQAALALGCAFPTDRSH